MSFDLYFQCPVSDSETVEQRNPFTGQTQSVPKPLQVEANSVSAMNADLQTLGFSDEADGLMSIQSDVFSAELGVDDQGGSLIVHINSSTDQQQISAALWPVVKRVYEAGFSVHIPNVEESAEPSEEAILEGLQSWLEFSENI